MATRTDSRTRSPASFSSRGLNLLIKYLQLRTSIGNWPTKERLPNDFSEFVAHIALSDAKKERVLWYLKQLERRGELEVVGDGDRARVMLTLRGDIKANGIDVPPKCRANWEKQLKRLEVWPSSVST